MDKAVHLELEAARFHADSFDDYHHKCLSHRRHAPSIFYASSSSRESSHLFQPLCVRHIHLLALQGLCPPLHQRIYAPGSHRQLRRQDWHQDLAQQHGPTSRLERMVAGFGENVNWSDGDDGHGYREMRIALEVAARRMERADLGFHEARIEVGRRAQRMVGVDRDDKGPARYLEGRDCCRSPSLVRVEVDMCCDGALTLYVSTRLSAGSQTKSGIIIPEAVAAAVEEADNKAVLAEVHNAVHHHRKVDMDTVVVDTDCLLVVVGNRVDSGSSGLPCCHELRCSVKMYQ